MTDISKASTAAVEKAVAALAGEERHQLWPRVAAERASVDVGVAREVMLDLVGAGLLYLDYVVMCPNGDKVMTTRHPERPPIGETRVCNRCEEPETFEITWDDVYMTFVPTDRLKQLISAGDDAVPKPRRVAGGADSPAARSGPSDEERVTASEHFDPETRTVIINVNNDYRTGNFGGSDNTFNDDRRGNFGDGDAKYVDKRSGNSGDGDGDRTNNETPPAPEGPKRSTISTVLLVAGIVVVLIGLIVAVVLRVNDTLKTPEAGFLATSSVIVAGCFIWASSHFK